MVVVSKIACIGATKSKVCFGGTSTMGDKIPAVARQQGSFRVCFYMGVVGIFKTNEGYSPSTKGVSTHGIAAIPVVSTSSDTRFVVGEKVTWEMRSRPKTTPIIREHSRRVSWRETLEIQKSFNFCSVHPVFVLDHHKLLIRAATSHTTRFRISATIQNSIDRYHCTRGVQLYSNGRSTKFSPLGVVRILWHTTSLVGEPLRWVLCRWPLYRMTGMDDATSADAIGDGCLPLRGYIGSFLIIEMP